MESLTKDEMKQIKGGLVQVCIDSVSDAKSIASKTCECSYTDYGCLCTTIPIYT